MEGGLIRFSSILLKDVDRLGGTDLNSKYFVDESVEKGVDGGNDGGRLMGS